MSDTNKYTIFRFVVGDAETKPGTLECYHRDEKALTPYADGIYQLKVSGKYVDQKTYDLFQKGAPFIDLVAFSVVKIKKRLATISINVYSSTDDSQDTASLKTTLDGLEKCLLDRGVVADMSRLLSSGSFGSAYISCINFDTRCERIVKIGQISESEIQIHRIAANLGLAPVVYDDWTCDDFPEENFVLMERLDGTLDGLGKSATSRDATEVVALIEKAEASGIFHQDIHFGNIMYKTVSGDRRWYLIDFGRSVYFPSGSLTSKYDSTVEKKKFVPGTEFLLYVINFVDPELFSQEFLDVLRRYILSSRFIIDKGSQWLLKMPDSNDFYVEKAY